MNWKGDAKLPVPWQKRSVGPPRVLEVNKGNPNFLLHATSLMLSQDTEDKIASCC